MGKSVRLVSFITFAMITMLISISISVNPQSFKPRMHPHSCFPPNSKEPCHNVQNRYEADKLCQKVCYSQTGYMAGKCISGAKGRQRQCWCGEC
ncbi:unnamed protein product [Arabidopsis halleri]